MDATLQPNMEAVTAPRMISGTAIVEDLIGRIAEKLLRDCSLRQSDCYRSYNARVTVELELQDVDVTTVNASVQVGSIDPGKAQRIAVNVPTAQAADLGMEPDSLEKPIDQTGWEPPAEKRIYVSKIRQRS